MGGAPVLSHLAVRGQRILRGMDGAHAARAHRGGTVAFSLIGQPFAAHRAASRGVEKDAYLRRQRVWAAVSVVAGCAMIAGATYYNLAIRPTLGA